MTLLIPQSTIDALYTALEEAITLNSGLSFEMTNHWAFTPEILERAFNGTGASPSDLEWYPASSGEGYHFDEDALASLQPSLTYQGTFKGRAFRYVRAAVVSTLALKEITNAIAAHGTPTATATATGIAIEDTAEEKIRALLSPEKLKELQSHAATMDECCKYFLQFSQFSSVDRQPLPNRLNVIRGRSRTSPRAGWEFLTYPMRGEEFQPFINELTAAIQRVQSQPLASYSGPSQLTYNAQEMGVEPSHFFVRPTKTGLTTGSEIHIRTPSNTQNRALLGMTDQALMQHIITHAFPGCTLTQHRDRAGYAWLATLPKIPPKQAQQALEQALRDFAVHVDVPSRKVSLAFGSQATRPSPTAKPATAVNAPIRNPAGLMFVVSAQALSDLDSMVQHIGRARTIFVREKQAWLFNQAMCDQVLRDSQYDRPHGLGAEERGLHIPLDEEQVQRFGGSYRDRAVQLATEIFTLDRQCRQLRDTLLTSGEKNVDGDLILSKEGAEKVASLLSRDAQQKRASALSALDDCCTYFQQKGLSDFVQGSSAYSPRLKTAFLPPFNSDEIQQEIKGIPSVAARMHAGCREIIEMPVSRLGITAAHFAIQKPNPFGPPQTTITIKHFPASGGWSKTGVSAKKITEILLRQLFPTLEKPVLTAGQNGEYQFQTTLAIRPKEAKKIFAERFNQCKLLLDAPLHEPQTTGSDPARADGRRWGNVAQRTPRTLE